MRSSEAIELWRASLLAPDRFRPASFAADAREDNAETA